MYTPKTHLFRGMFDSIKSPRTFAVGAFMVLVGLTSATAQPVAAEPAPAGWVITPSGQLRDRLVLDSGRDFLDRTGPAHRRYVTQRARMGVQGQHDSGLTVKVVAQDVRIWGEESDPTAFVAKGLDFYEAYAGIPITKDLSVTLGRQGLSWDNERLMGKLDWAQRARAFDALRLDYQYDSLQVQAFAAHLGNDSAQAEADGHAADAPGTERVLGGAHLAWQVATDWKLAAVYLYRSSEALQEDRHTAGAFMSGKAVDGAVAVMGEAYGQFGDIANRPISAWMGALRFTFKAPVVAGPGVTLFGEALSGDRTKQGAFDTLYGTNHKFYGEMDLFLDIPKHTALHGLVDAGAGVFASPTAWLTTSVDYHLLRTLREHIASANSELGHEVDVKATAVVHKNLSVQAVYGLFLPGGALRGIRGLVASPATEQMLFVTVDANF